MQAIPYWRLSQQWSQIVNQVGEVVVATRLYVSASNYQQQVPYDVALVDFGNSRMLLPVAVSNQVVSGMKVRVVIRKVEDQLDESVIAYGPKVVALSNQELKE